MEHLASEGKWQKPLNSSLHMHQYSLPNESKRKRAEWEKPNRMIRILPFKILPTSSTHYVLMCKLDNKIRTCLLAVYGTYQHKNLIPASLFTGPRFTALLLDSITFFSNGAATRGMAGIGWDIIAKNTKLGPTADVHTHTKNPLWQHMNGVRCWGIDTRPRSSQRGHSTPGNADLNSPNTAEMATPFQHRYTVSKQVYWPAEAKLHIYLFHMHAHTLNNTKDTHIQCRHGFSTL